MTRHLILFEDDHWRSLRPLTDLAAVPALPFGAATLGARWMRILEAPLLAIEARAGALGLWRDAPRVADARPQPGDEVLALNAAALPGDWLDAALERPAALLVSGDRLAGARLPAGRAASGLGRGEGFESFLRGLDLPALEVQAELVRWPWQLIEKNADAIRADLGNARGEVRGEVHRLAALIEPQHITIEPGARVDPFAVLDAREGPILIGGKARILAHSAVTGPCVVGEGTHVLGGVVASSTIGPGCRIAGEVDATLWQGWANKRHHGFVGHSVIGEWVNLGALTTTSDLKNNYGPVRVWVDGREVESGSSKLGSVIGAHVKTGIGTLLPTGASIGPGANLFGGGRFAPKHVPAFGWWDGERMEVHRFDKFLATARIAMARRERVLGAAEETALRALFEATRAERDRECAGSAAP